MNWKSITTLLLFLPASVFGQAAGGVAGISGSVHDSSGAAVPNAKVVISSAGQGQVRSITSNGAGLFTAPSLIAGSGYQLTVTATGFSQYDVKDIDLQVGQKLDLNIKLQVGTATTQVEVTATSPLVDDTKNDVSTVVDNQQIQELPVNGRRVDSFVLLTPGVTNDATFGLLSFRGVAGNNSFLVDGNDNTEQFYDENAGRTRIQSQISQDAVQEFQVVSDDYSAEYGRAMGGVVNTVTKSGTNQVHGTGFYYYRSRGFDARDPFSVVNNVGLNPAEKRVEGGATVGGPIKKDKLFFLINFDLTHRLFPMVDSYVSAGVINPATDTWATSGSGGCVAPATPAQCNAINALLPRFFGQIPRTDDNDLAFGRLDYHASDKNTFTAEFNFLRWWSPNGIQTGLSSTSGAAITGNGDDSVRVRNGKLGWTSVPTSTFVNTFRFGWDTDRQADAYDQAELGSGLGLLDVSVDGVQLGAATYLPRVEPAETRYEFSDDATLIKSNHTIKFGFGFYTTDDFNSYMSNRFGSYTYATPTTFAEDYSNAAGVVGAATGKNWTGFSQTFGNPIADYRINELAFYLLDQWKVSPKFTVNLGVRYDKSLSMNFPISNPAWPDTAFIHTPSGNFAPRVGMSYRIDDKTVLRGGFGMFYARLLGGLIDNLWTTNGIYQTPESLSSSQSAQLAAGPNFPNVLAAPPTGASVSASTIQFAAPNLKTPYSAQANLTLQRQISKDMVVSVSGIASRGIHLTGATDVNAPQPSGSYTYLIDNSSGTQTGTFTTPLYFGPRPNPNFGTVYENTNGVDSVYDALAATFTKRFSHGIQMLASYTWSHEIDDGQEQASNAIFFSSITTTYNGNNSFERGSGWLDQRNRFVYSFVWAPTVVHSDGAAKYLLNGWQLSAITTLQSGRPYSSPTVSVSSAPATCSATVTTSCITLPAGATGLLTTGELNGFAGNTRAPFLPVNSIFVPAAYRADARLSKVIPIKIGDRTTNLSLNFEAFNVSNSWSPTAMSSKEYTAVKGVLTQSVSGPFASYGIGTADGGFPDGTQARRLQVSARFTF